LCAEKLARNTPEPHRKPAVIATTRGLVRCSHSPPSTAAHPRKNQLIVNVSVTWEIVHPNSFESGIRNTLQA
jgi:hypothetical protein